MAVFCEVSCVKYCVFAFPLGFTAVQTHGVASSALRRIHAPTRNEEGTYIGASVASDLDTLSTPNTPSHQGMMMYNFCWVGGWHARALFIFASPCRHWFLVLFCSVLSAWSPFLSLSPYLALYFVARSRLPVYLVTLACPFFFALLGSSALFQLVAMYFIALLNRCLTVA